MRNFGLDVHRTFAEVALLDERGVRSAGRIDLTAEALHAFGRQLAQDDDVVLEATCNTHAIARLLGVRPARGGLEPAADTCHRGSQGQDGQIDAAVLARLHASGFLPEVWSPDEFTEQLRRHVARRATIVQHRTRLKNRIHAFLHRNLLPRRPATDLFGRKGRSWLTAQALPTDERV